MNTVQNYFPKHFMEIKQNLAGKVLAITNVQGGLIYSWEHTWRTEIQGRIVNWWNITLRAN